MMVYHFNIVNSIIVDVLLIIGLILLIYLSIKTQWLIINIRGHVSKTIE